MDRTRLQDLVIGIIVAVIGAAGWVATYKMPEATQRYTFCVTGIFAFLGILLIAQSILRRNVPNHDSVVRAAEFKNPVIAFILVAVYAFSLDKIGFFVSSAIFMFVMALFMGYRKYLKIAITIVGLLGFIYLLFVFQLNVPLPSGILF